MPDMTVMWSFIMSWIAWFFEKGLAGFAAAWNASRQATEIALVVAVAFVAAIYFGFAKAPRVPAEIPEMQQQISDLAAKIDRLADKSDIEALRADILNARASPIVTGSVKPKKK